MAARAHQRHPGSRLTKDQVVDQANPDHVSRIGQSLGETNVFGCRSGIAGWVGMEDGELRCLPGQRFSKEGTRLHRSPASTRVAVARSSSKPFRCRRFRRTWCRRPRPPNRSSKSVAVSVSVWTMSENSSPSVSAFGPRWSNRSRGVSPTPPPATSDAPQNDAIARSNSKPKPFRVSRWHPPADHTERNRQRPAVL